LVNGDVGEVISYRRNELIVNFYGKRYTLTKKNGLKNIKLAYVTTVHKSQGSEYPLVVFVCTPAKVGNYKSLMYTAATRARNCLVLIGDIKDMDEAVSRDKRYSRDTLLGGFLSGAFSHI
jgi:exodeoxyribonuclease V alpha subunit